MSKNIFGEMVLNNLNCDYMHIFLLFNIMCYVKKKYNVYRLLCTDYCFYRLITPVYRDMKIYMI